VELDWTTFILEIINFLVLVWILRRFLYRPVMNVVAQRRATIAQNLQEAQTTQEQAAALKTQYENRLADWQQERETARQQLRDEIEAERRKLMKQVETELAEQRHKEEVLAARRDENRLHLARRQALTLSSQFAAKLLTRLAAPALENRLLDVLVEDLDRSDEEQHASLADALNNAQGAVQIISAFSLEDEQGQRLTNALQRISATPVHCDFRQDPALLAGISIHIGSLQLQANLKEELRFFAEALSHE